MTVSDFQVKSVIRTYLKNVKSDAKETGRESVKKLERDAVIISEDGMKKVLLEKNSEEMSERLRKHDKI
jgi:ribosomal protein S20